MYRVRIEKQAAKTLEKLELGIRTRIIEATRGLVKNPRPPGSKKMKNREVWRIRIGDYRIIYGINDEDMLVSVAKIGHRRDVYRRA